MELRGTSSNAVDVSIVMPCLNEAASLPHCIDSAYRALQQIREGFGLEGEIIVADNGSTDGSQTIASRLGATVVAVQQRGYGAALRGGFARARGTYLVMGDADGSYDFTDCVAMIGHLLDGADLCMGSRFSGHIKPGAMPWKNRYIGNPVLTGILNLFFRSGVRDAHCGLRAIRKDIVKRLCLEGIGMEFASEMLVKATLQNLIIREVPVSLSPDMRGRPPHLRPWRDGWRHLRYLLMLSPTWAFAVPAFLIITLSVLIIGTAISYESGILSGDSPVGANWIILAAFGLATGHFGLLAAVVAHVYGAKSGIRKLPISMRRLAPVLTLEHILGAGALLLSVSIISLAMIGWSWSAHDFTAPRSVLPVALAACSGSIGLQSILGAFLIAVVSGHDAHFLSDAEGRREISETGQIVPRLQGDGTPGGP